MATEAHGEAGQAVGMPQLDFSTWPNQIFWLLVTLVVIYLVLSRVALPRIGGVLAERKGTITNDLAAAEELKVPFLGELPLDMPMRRAGDDGEPILMTHPDSEQSVFIKEIAGKLARQISIESRKFRPLNVV